MAGEERAGFPIPVRHQDQWQILDSDLSLHHDSRGKCNVDATDEGRDFPQKPRPGMPPTPPPAIPRATLAGNLPD
jgi:hypothetical protein